LFKLLFLNLSVIAVRKTILLPHALKRIRIGAMSLVRFVCDNIICLLKIGAKIILFALNSNLFMEKCNKSTFFIYIMLLFALLMHSELQNNGHTQASLQLHASKLFLAFHV